MTTTNVPNYDAIDAATDAVAAGDARALAAALLRRYRKPWRSPRDLFARAAQHAAELTARSLTRSPGPRSLTRSPGPRDVKAANVYADAFALLDERDLHAIMRRQRDRARAALATGGAR